MAEDASKDEILARRCRTCPVCSRARRKQKGPAYWFVKNIEPLFSCPYCAAYERVTGKKPFEP